MLNEEVTSGNGVVKNVVAQNQQELDETVSAVRDEHADPAPDINNPADGNKIVSPDNQAVEDIPSVVDNDVEVNESDVADQQAEPDSPPKTRKSKK